MKKLLLSTILALALLTGCSDDDDQTYLYTIGIDGFSFSSTGTGILSPLEYLESLGLKSSLSITSDSQSKANEEAISQFNTEMNKIDEVELNLSGSDYVTYALHSVMESKDLKEKTFGTKSE